jgi:hypothetical protein
MNIHDIPTDHVAKAEKRRAAVRQAIISRTSSLRISTAQREEAIEVGLRQLAACKSAATSIAKGVMHAGQLES